MNAVLQPPDETPAPGDAPPPDALAIELQRLDVLIERAIQRLRARYELSTDEWRGLYVTDAYVDGLLRAQAGPDESLANPFDDLQARILSATEAVLSAPPQPCAWHALAHALRLSRVERDVLLGILAPELDARYGPLYAYLNDDAMRRAATPDLLARLFGDDPQQRLAVRTAVSPAGRLFELGLIEWLGTGRDAASRAQRGLRVQPALADWLAGLPYVDERLRGVTVGAPAELAASTPLAEAQETLVRRLAAQVLAGRPMPVVVCHATHLTEALALAHTLFGAAQRPVLQIDLLALRSSAEVQEVAAAIELVAAVFGMGVVLAPLSALRDGEGLRDAAATAVRWLCLRLAHVALVDDDRRAWRQVLGDALPREVIELPVAELALDERIDAWERAIDDAEQAGLRIGMVDAAALADRFALGPARIARAVRSARHAATLQGDGLLGSTQLFEAARTTSASASSSVTRPVQTPFEWEDLVLPPTVQERLLDIVHAVELRPRVLQGWGFERRTGCARGVKAMFAGASGTGKTMAAAVIAKTLSLDLHRVELSSTVSKYLGETEKNLDRAFDAARCCNAILFIDEADALFGKRSEVKDAHDRYANVETAYLLQKMEDHDGVVILATNLANNIDDAFSRRMHFVVEFPLPDPPRRELLWRGMFPADAPLADDVDFGFLARQFAFAGGDIRNIVLDAAYAAAREDAGITMAHLLRAVARQYAKRGKVASASDFREYAHLLVQPAAPAEAVPSHAP